MFPAFQRENCIFQKLKFLEINTFRNYVKLLQIKTFTKSQNGKGSKVVDICVKLYLFESTE